MLRAKITYRETPIEAEADTKRDLEDALEVALNVVVRLNLAPPQAYREPETQGAGGIPSVPPPEATQPLGGATPPKHAADPSKPQVTRPVSYRGAKTIGDHIYIALKDLAEQNGVDRGYTNREIIDHLEETGSKIIKTSKSKYPIRSVGQAVRFDKEKRFARKDDLTWLSEWLTEAERESHTQLDSGEESESSSSEPLVSLDF